MKITKLNWAILVLTILTTTIACNSDDDATLDTTSEFQLNIDGLEDLGSDYAYEGWIIVDGAPKTTGVFTIDANGNLSTNTFAVDADDLTNASTFVLTIEPSPDNDPAPSSVHILGGDITDGIANLTIGHATALGTDLMSSTGNYILATPTNGNDNDERSGVWWLDPTAGPGAGLSLPTLPDGWIYEGWAVINGTPVSTGTFRSATGADNSAAFSGTMAGPPFPGEDFLQNAPDGLTFPVDLSEGIVVISVEPFPDNSAAPFLLKPLVGAVPANAPDHSLLGMDNNAAATNPTGSFAVNR